MTYVMGGGGGGGGRNDDVTKIMPPPKQQVKKSKRPLSAVIEEFEHGNDARANSLLLQPGGIKNGVEEVEEKGFSSSSEKNNNGDISSEGKGGDEASGDRSLSPTVLVPLENGVEGDGGNKDVASSSSSSSSSSIVASLKMTSSSSSSSSSTSSSSPTSSRTAQTQSSSATLSLARPTGVPAITVTVAGPEAKGGKGESAGTSTSQLPAMPSALTSPPPPRMNSLFRSSPPSSSPPSPSSPSSLSSTSLSLGRRQALTSPSSFSSSFLLNNLNLQKQQRPPLPSLSLPQRTLMTSRLPVHHEEGSDDGDDNNNDNDEDKDSKASSSPDTLSPSATADMARLRQTADRLRLSTRRPSVMQWRARYVVECPRFPLTSSAGSGSADVTGGGEGDVTRGPKNGEGGEEEGGEGEEGGRWTEERKQRIDTAFQWIYNELYEMRAQDQQLARQLLTLRTDLHKLKLARSCEEHQDMLDDVQSELEDLQELADVLDLPTPTMADTPLQHLGVTRWNFTARRFSTC